jgi:hypothetical protein
LVRPAPPVPPAPPAGFKSLAPFDREWAGDFKGAWEGAAVWAGNPWEWAFSQSQSQSQSQTQTQSQSQSQIRSTSQGGVQTEALELGFTDPSRPGTLDVNLFSGSVTVRGTARKDVSIKVTHRGRDSAFERNAPPPPAGMRRLTPNRRGDLAVQEDNNRMTVRSMTMLNEMDVEIEVPARTNLTIRTVNGGAIEVENVEGALEVNNVNGPIRLTGVSGSAVASATNGQVLVRLTRVTDAKAMAFSSFNGTVDVTLPATTKANLKLRSDNGDVFTDFDVTETAPPNPAGWVKSNRGDKRVRFEGNSTVYGTINGGGPEIEARSFNGSVFIRKAQ